MEPVVVPALSSSNTLLESSKMHPFFAAKPLLNTTQHDENAQGISSKLSPPQNLPAPELTSATPAHNDRPKRRKASTALPASSTAQEEQPKKKKRGRPRKSTCPEPLNGFLLPEEADTSGAESVDIVDKAMAGTSQLSLASHNTPSSDPLHALEPLKAINNASTISNSKKIVKFNPKTGTFGSPPKPKTAAAAAAAASPPSRVVTISYGANSEDDRKRIGEQITAILEGAKTNSVPKPSPPVALPPKTTHPFFMGGLKKPTTTANNTTPDTDKKTTSLGPPPKKIATATPCSPKKSSSNNFYPTNIPRFGVKNSGVKVPGACYPAWPAKGMSHVRGDSPTGHPEHSTAHRHAQPTKKSKGHVVVVPPADNIISFYSAALSIDAVRQDIADTSDVSVPPNALRLPRKRCESGKKLQKRIRPELQTYRLAGRPSTLDDDDDDELASSPVLKTTHPGVSNLFDSLPSGLSAFDRSQCESVSWAQKYAPRSAVEILQHGKECLLIRDWLHALKVLAVDTGEVKTDRAKAEPKKKKRKTKLDGFVVSSDEEDDDMDELADEADAADWTSSASTHHRPKTVVRNNGEIQALRDSGKIKNGILISGPPGIGKTAAVYAIAHELDFEVFEINASSRRSGKDILEKVGDMTRNHLVQHRRTESEQPAEDGLDNSEVLSDIQAGKQATMASFFQAKPAVAAKTQKSKSAPIPKPSRDIKSLSAAAAPAAAAAKNQKQSLILIEEADILFEEDKQFWTTLLGLMAQSKRPFVFTCNEEELVPLQSLDLHGIFRFTNPPADLAVDALILIAAHEGHALERIAVQALYEARCHDLRACITDLNFWCQLGIGDRRGGFDWFYPRWPRGRDLDEDGDVVRVISDGTYLEGMGWLGQDAIDAADNGSEQQRAEIAQQTWDFWDLDLPLYDTLNETAPSLLTSTSTTPGRAAATTTTTTTTILRQQKLAALESWSEFCDSMSSADVFSCGGFALGHEDIIDHTLPEMSVKSRDDFIIGRKLLEAVPLMQCWAPHVDMSRTTQLLAQHALSQHISRPTLDTTQDYEHMAYSSILTNIQSPPMQAAISRYDMSLAFDPIAVSPKANPTPGGGYLEPSVFDRTMAMITLDVAPYVRGIVAYDQRLMHERLLKSNLLSGGGGGAATTKKRIRSTRSALSALEGGSRSTTRRENYFAPSLNAHLVARTAGVEWDAAALRALVLAEEAELVGLDGDDEEL